MSEKMVILGVDALLGSSVSITASSAVASMPATNILDHRPGVVWRATGASAETLTVDFGEEVDLDTLAVIGHNGSLDATVRVEIATDAGFATVLFDQTYELWPPVYGLGEGGLGNYFGGYVDPQELGAFVSLRAIRLGAVYSARYMRLTFTDTSSPISAIEVGKVMAGIGDQFASNFAHGWREDEVDRSVQRLTDGGALVVQERPIFPRLTVTLPNLRKSEAITTVKTLKRTNGRKRPVLVLLEPDASDSTIYRTSIYGMFSNYSETEYPRFDRAVWSFTVDGLV